MKHLKKWKDGETWMVQVQCPDCHKLINVKRTNSYKMKSCKSCSVLRRSKRITKHGMYSKHLPNPELAACLNKVSLMAWRVYSNHYRTASYKGICKGLDLKKSGAYAAARKLLETIGPPPNSFTIEKIGNSYCCGSCDECKKKKQACTLIGWIPAPDQVLTRTTSHVFQNGTETRCLNKLHELLNVREYELRHLIYRRFKHIQDMREKWLAVSQHLIQARDDGCPQCSKTYLVDK